MQQIPLFNYDDDVNEYFKKVEKIKAENDKANYKCILDFINVWLSNYDLNINALLKFKNIPVEKVTSKQDVNKRLYKKFAPILSKKFNLKIKEKVDSDEEVLDVDTDELDEDVLVLFIGKLLKKINYKLVTTVPSKIRYFSIVKQ